ncbi:Leucine-rich repeat (LRR) family protein [Abeliophyllum distichum]|uniref:Leucine-rich repeat (LRR) family protein n=1 Tax=Abeliophyllum distichum TaxID=126358 RepID=A0ABD1VTU2_9LAMI
MFNASNSLYKLDLFRSDLSSSCIFPWLFNFRSGLSYIELGWNKLQRPIPDDIGNLLSLSYLSLNTNQLEGEIPISLENLSSLLYLELPENQFEGEIPISLGESE